MAGATMPTQTSKRQNRQIKVTHGSHLSDHLHIGAAVPQQATQGLCHFWLQQLRPA